MNFMRIVWFDFLNICRNPMLVMINTVGQMMIWGGFGLVTSGQFGGTINSFDYYGVATMTLSSILISMTVTNTFMEEKVKRGNLRIAYAPVSKAEIYLSKLLSTFIFGVIAFTLLCLIEQYVFQSNFGGNNIFYVIALIDILALFGCSLGALVVVIFKSEERANAVMPIISILFIFFGGVFSPIGHFGTVMQTIAQLSPAKWVLQSAFQIIYDNNFSLFLPVIACLLIFSIFFTLIGQFIFKPEEYL
ncbi:ABC transporter permease [Paenibacillus puerhi]|uniref:ABC transporter permease n=1 Tax=Paenibacillus puerhi TaxID=2692622 RepID=UPI0013596F17|nr:ABC transporter permease [Paenibacillus puerhi]